MLVRQFQSAIIATVLAAGWTWSGIVRLRELRRVRAAARGRVLRATAAGSGMPAASAEAAVTMPLLPPPQSPMPAGQIGPASRKGSYGSLSQGLPDGKGKGALAAAAAADERALHPAAWPAVSVVLPVKGQRPHSREAWASQLAMHYGETSMQERYRRI